MYNGLTGEVDTDKKQFWRRPGVLIVKKGNDEFNIPSNGTSLGAYGDGLGFKPSLVMATADNLLSKVFKIPL